MGLKCATESKAPLLEIRDEEHFTYDALFASLICDFPYISRLPEMTVSAPSLGILGSRARMGASALVYDSACQIVRMK